MSTAKNGWAHNPGIVMLHSGDLINWSHSFVDLEPGLNQLIRNYRDKSAEEIESILTTLTPESVTIFKTRTAANNDLRTIVDRITRIEKTAEIPKEKLDEIKAKCKLPPVYKRDFFLLFTLNY